MRAFGRFFMYAGSGKDVMDSGQNNGKPEEDVVDAREDSEEGAC